MSSAKCRLLAVDLDGTLVNSGKMDPQDVQALHEAAGGGITVCLCTGRSWKETRPVWEQLALPEPAAPVICVGGAVVVEPRTGRSLYSLSFNHDVACELAGAMRQRGYPVMALVDAWREDFDYFMVGRYEAFPMYRKFFDRQGAGIRFVEELDGMGSARTLRISIMEQPDRTSGLLADLRAQFAGRAEMQAIHAPNYGVHILEAFAAGANKLSGLLYVGQAMRIGLGGMAAIGDDYNDIPMLSGVAFSACPADAPDDVKASAKRLVAPRGQGAVAEFVGTLLA